MLRSVVIAAIIFVMVQCAVIIQSDDLERGRKSSLTRPGAAHAHPAGPARSTQAGPAGPIRVGQTGREGPPEARTTRIGVGPGPRSRAVASDSSGLSHKSAGYNVTL
jgi:hypothetical protein